MTRWDRYYWLPLIVALAALTVVAVSVARGSESASFKFDPRSNEGVLGFMGWLGIKKLTEDQVVEYWSERGVESILTTVAIAAQRDKCVPSSAFLGFFQHPMEPDIRVICNGPPVNESGLERGFTPEEAARICRIYETDFGSWFPGSPHRPPELECVRPAKARPSSTPRGHLKPGEEIAVDTNDPQSIQDFQAAIGAVLFDHPEDARRKARCEVNPGRQYVGSFRSPTGLEGSFCASTLPAAEDWARDLCESYAGLTFRRVDSEHPAVVVCARFTFGASCRIDADEREQQLWSPDGFPMSNVTVRWEIKTTPENTSERGFAALWEKWESDCKRIGGNFFGITTNYERGTHTGFCNVPKIRAL